VTSRSDNTPQILNRQEALERLGGDEEMLSEFLGLLLEQVDSMLPEMQQALANRDATSMERLGHSLKGAAASLGAEKLRNAAYELETLGRSGSLDKAAESIETIEEQAGFLRQFIEG
jgi:two-component system, sensor histidine kinase and response regulator